MTVRPHRLFPPLALILVFVLALPLHAELESAGTVSRIQGNAVAVQDALPRPLKVGSEVYIGDILSTGAGARLEIRMIDDGLFTLGERTTFVVVDYSFDGVDGTGKTRLLEGAFQAVSGALAKVAEAPFTVETEFATIGIRGTTFWGGKLPDGEIHVALLEGKSVVVENRAGRVEITTVGDGTHVAGPDQPPSPPKHWGEKKHHMAHQMTSFGPE